MGSPALLDADRADLCELAPLLRRVIDLDAAIVARLRVSTALASIYVRLPFGVLISRTVRRPGDTADEGGGRDLDAVVSAADLLSWLDDSSADPPTRRDADWRAGLPPLTGWRRVETVPDDVVRGLVRRGALALKDAAAREGVPGAQPRAEVADALLDSAVLTVSDDSPGSGAAIPLRVLSAMTRMGFLPRGGEVHVDLVGRWIRVVAGYGSAYLERPGSGLGLLLG